MKRNDFQEIKGLSIKAITEKIKAAKKEIADLVIDKNMSKLKDLKSISKKRKDVAQMMTVLRQKELLEQLGESEKPKTMKKTVDKQSLPLRGKKERKSK